MGEQHSSKGKDFKDNTKSSAGSTEKKKRGRGRKKLPELPDCFPRIDAIISAMGGKKVRRKKEEIDDEEDSFPKRRHQGGN